MKGLSPRLLAALLILTLFAGLAAISADSLWIDEGNAAYKACQPTFGKWVTTMKAEGGSDVQMPLYMGWLWVWEKGFGHSERTLRLANLPWIFLGHLFLLGAVSRSRLSPRVGIVYAGLAAVAPFLFYYANEVRPYAMDYGAACLILAYLLEIDAAPERALQPRLLITGIAGMLLLAGSSLLGVPWAGSGLLAAVWIVWKGDPGLARRLRWSAASLLAMGALFVGMALLGFYYLETLKAGAGAANIGQTGVLSCLFAGYELAGLAGIGPNRTDLRVAGMGALFPYILPLATGCLVVFGVGMAGAINYARATARRLPLSWVCIAFLLPLVFTLGLGIVGHFRVLGRHLMPGFPILLLMVAFALDALLRTPWRGLVALFVGIWVYSSASLRFSPTHFKDDYRASSALARNVVSAGKSVWWAADVATGRYYGLDFAPKGRVLHWMNAPEADLLNQPEPDLVILSKRDIYDHDGTLERYLSLHGFTPWGTYTAFTIFEKKPGWAAGRP